MRRILRVAAPLAAGLLIGACFGGLKNGEPAPLNYRISAPKLAAGDPLAADVLIVVEATAPGAHSAAGS